MLYPNQYITTDRSIPSKSGLYAQDLPGVDAGIWEKIAKEQQTEDELWLMLYEKSWNNLVSDITTKWQKKFYVDSKLISRETSQFLESTNDSSEEAGVNIQFGLPRYARLHIVSIQVFLMEDYEKEVEFSINDKNGEQLAVISATLQPGYNTVSIEQEFDHEEVNIVYDAVLVDLRTTELKKYLLGVYRYSCNQCEYDCGGYKGRVTQLNNGGLNVVYNVVCSIEKFVAQNINFFKQAWFFRLGLEIVTERTLGHRLNKYMTLTKERLQELMAYYSEKYEANLELSTKSHNIKEDPYCFSCMSNVSKVTSLP